MRSPLAIPCRISAEGLRSPRSIWLRYGLEMPASSLSFRSDSRSRWRWSRMNSPRSRRRASTASAGVLTAPTGSSRRIGREACGDGLGQRVEHAVQRAPTLRDVALELAQLGDRGLELRVGEVREVRERAVGDQALEPTVPLDAGGRREHRLDAGRARAAAAAVVGEDRGQRGDEVAERAARGAPVTLRGQDVDAALGQPADVADLRLDLEHLALHGPQLVERPPVDTLEVSGREDAVDS